MTIVELFSGVGGLGLGFRVAGYSVEVAVDADCHRVETYKANVGPRKALCADVRELDFSKWRGVDVLLAGPPCRPYSSATPPGKRGAAHPEYGLDAEVLRAASEVRPRAVVVEEVPGWDPRGLAAGLAKLGYGVAYELVDFSEFGVPIARRRWILVAHKGAQAGAAFKALYSLREPPPKPIDVLTGLPPEPCTTDPCRWGGRLVYNHVASEVRSRLREVVPLIPPGYSLIEAHRAGIVDAGKYVSKPENKHRYWMYRVPLDRPAKVVPHPRRSIMLHPTQHRMVTVRELARLMAFPDWFNFRPLASLDAMYRAIADSVPPKFSEKLAAALAAVLDGQRRS